MVQQRKKAGDSRERSPREVLMLFRSCQGSRVSHELKEVSEQDMLFVCGKTFSGTEDSKYEQYCQTYLNANSLVY